MITQCTDCKWLVLLRCTGRWIAEFKVSQFCLISSTTSHCTLKAGRRRREKKAPGLYVSLGALSDYVLWSSVLQVSGYVYVCSSGGSSTGPSLPPSNTQILSATIQYTDSLYHPASNTQTLSATSNTQTLSTTILDPIHVHRPSLPPSNTCTQTLSANIQYTDSLCYHPIHMYRLSTLPSSAQTHQQNGLAGSIRLV